MYLPLYVNVFGNLTLNVSVDSVNVTGVVDFVYRLMSGKHNIARTRCNVIQYSLLLYNIASCWLYLKEYINNARSHECQIAGTDFEKIFLSDPAPVLEVNNTWSLIVSVYCHAVYPTLPVS